MCLANEVKLDTLKTQLHGQVREAVFRLCYNTVTHSALVIAFFIYAALVIAVVPHAALFNSELKYGFCLCYALNTCQQRIEIWFEKKVCMKWKSLHIGDKCVENLACLAFCLLLSIRLFVHSSFQVQERKDGP